MLYFNAIRVLSCTRKDEDNPIFSGLVSLYAIWDWSNIMTQIFVIRSLLPNFRHIFPLDQAL